MHIHFSHGNTRNPQPISSVTCTLWLIVYFNLTHNRDYNMEFTNHKDKKIHHIEPNYLMKTSPQKLGRESSSVT